MSIGVKSEAIFERALTLFVLNSPQYPGKMECETLNKTDLMIYPVLALAHSIFPGEVLNIQGIFISPYVHPCVYLPFSALAKAFRRLTEPGLLTSFFTRMSTGLTDLP